MSLPTDLLSRSQRRGGVMMWSVLTVGIWAWAAHLLYLASVVEASCAHAWVEWTMHAATVATAVPTVVGGWLCWAMVRSGPDPEGAGTIAGRTRFLGLGGLAVNLTSLVLILLEGSYVPFLSPCA